jgi:hypothetical protein
MYNKTNTVRNKLLLYKLVVINLLTYYIRRYQACKTFQSMRVLYMRRNRKFHRQPVRHDLPKDRARPDAARYSSMHVDQITQNVIVKIEKSRRVVELRPVCQPVV